MSQSAIAVGIGLALVLGLSAGIFASIEMGRRIGTRRMARDPEGVHRGVGPFEGATYGLMSLLIAFIFTGAAQRFDHRRILIVQEANAISTAYLRLDVIPAEAQPPMRACFRQYLDARLEFFRELTENPDRAQAAMERANRIQKEIWDRGVAAVKASPVPPTATILLPALNEMIDVTTTRTVAGKTHPPLGIYVLLGAMIIASALLMGHGLAGRPHNWLHTGTFAVVIAVSMYVILDFEFPRVGLIRIDAVDQTLVDLRASFGN